MLTGFRLEQYRRTANKPVKNRLGLAVTDFQEGIHRLKNDGRPTPAVHAITCFHQGVQGHPHVHSMLALSGPETPTQENIFTPLVEDLEYLIKTQGLLHKIILMNCFDLRGLESAAVVNLGQRLAQCAEVVIICMNDAWDQSINYSAHSQFCSVFLNQKNSHTQGAPVDLQQTLRFEFETGEHEEEFQKRVRDLPSCKQKP